MHCWPPPMKVLSRETVMYEQQTLELTNEAIWSVRYQAIFHPESIIMGRGLWLDNSLAQ